MSIDQIYGPIGSGKTYHIVANFICRAIKERRKIFTNIEGLRLRELSHVTGVPISEIDITVLTDKLAWEKKLKLSDMDTDYSSVSDLKNSLCVIDEAQMIWYNRDYEKTSKEFIFFLTKSRHFDCDLVFVSQSLANVDVAIRRLGNYFWSIGDNKIFGLWRVANSYTCALRLSPEPDAPVWTSKSYTREPKYFRCFSSATDTTFQLQRKFSIPNQIKILLLIFALGAASLSWGVGRKVYRARQGHAVPSVIPSQFGGGDYLGIPRKTPVKPSSGVSEPSPEAVSVPSPLPPVSAAVIQSTDAQKVPARRGGCITFENGEKNCKYEFR